MIELNGLDENKQPNRPNQDRQAVDVVEGDIRLAGGGSQRPGAEEDEQAGQNPRSKRQPGLFFGEFARAEQVAQQVEAEVTRRLRKKHSELEPGKTVNERGDDIKKHPKTNKKPHHLT